MQYYQIVLPFPLDTESCHFPTNMGERRGTTACYFLVPSFPHEAWGMGHEAGAAATHLCSTCRHFFVATCAAPLPHTRDSPHLPQAGYVLWAQKWNTGGKSFLVVRLVKLWHSLTSELVESPSSEKLKTQLTLLWATCCSCLEQRLGWILSRDAFLSQLVCVFCIKKLGIPHLNCYMPMKNKHQCLRTPMHFTAFYFSASTARNVMPMAREVVNYRLL